MNSPISANGKLEIEFTFALLIWKLRGYKNPPKMAGEFQVWRKERNPAKADYSNEIIRTLSPVSIGVLTNGEILIANEDQQQAIKKRQNNL